jgi:hypothetical protein
MRCKLGCPLVEPVGPYHTMTAWMWGRGGMWLAEGKGRAQ